MAEKKKGVDISKSNVKVKISSSTPSPVKKMFKWIIILAVFYLLTSATVSSGIVEVTKVVPQNYNSQEPVMVEKLVKTTKYREEKVPFGTPRCEQFTYNFSKTYAYTETVDNSQKYGICTFNVKNEEDLAGNFTFYPNINRNGRITDGPDQTKPIDAFATVKYDWNFTLDVADTGSCMLQCNNCPTRIRCFYLEPTTYAIKQVPYTVEELKNVTEYNPITKTRTVTVKENVTQNIYTNRYFGYNQFFYFGY